MKPISLILLLAFLVACSHGVGSSSSIDAIPVAPGTNFSQYIIVGDSLMDLSSGGELTTTASLLLLEEQKSVTNFSLAGQSMAGIYGEGGAQKDGVGGAINYLTVPPESLWHDPPGTAVIVELGHNDWYAATAEDEFYDSYIQFLQAIDRTKLVVVFCVVPVPAKWDYNGHKNANGLPYEAFREIVRKISDTSLCHLIETRDWFTEEDVRDQSVMSDGVHLAPGGHRIYKDRLVRELSNY